MYSRSYGSIESERKSDGVSIPADYNGSLYASKTERTEIRKKQEEPPLKEDVSEAIPEPGTEPPASHGTGSGLLERFSAEDIILFVLVFLLLKEDSGDHGIILAVILAILLL